MAAIGRDKQEFALAEAFMGRSTRSIAEDLGITHGGVARFLASPEAKSRLAAMRHETNAAVGRQGGAAVARAVRVLTDGLDATKRVGLDAEEVPDEEHRRKCANDLLDRFGFAKGAKHEITGADGGALETTGRITLAGLSPEQIEATLRGLGAGDE